ncbi:hypothetical protein IKF33_00010 [Candidatus Saccharibacteria bacterium]|nr:hypothetical protein [Candidatus Saccharibacteria bacterium]
MKKQVLASVLLATLMVGVSANDSYAEYNEYRGDVPENGGDMSSPFVITEVNLRDNYLKVIYNGGIEGEVKLRNVDLLTWKPGAAGGKDNEDYLDWVLPSIHYSTPSYAYVVYNKSHYLFGNKFAKGVEEMIGSSEMHSPLSDSPNMKLYYSIYVGPNTQQTSFYTGKINYERCAGSRVFNREEMTCKVETKANGNGIQYQPYVVATGERVEVPEDYDVVPDENENGTSDVSGDNSGGGASGDGSQDQNQSDTQASVEAKSVEYAIATSGAKSVGVMATTSSTGGEMIIATPVNKGMSKETTDTGMAEVLSASLGEIADDDRDDVNGWGILIGVLGAIGVIIAGWWIFLLIKRRHKDED